MKSAGFSLLEILCVLAISSLLLLAVYPLFFHQEQQYQQQNNMLIAQENTRLALHLLKKNIQTAGEAGCLSVADLKLYNHLTDLPLELKIIQQYAIYGFDGHANGWTPSLPAQLTNVAPQTDVIWVEKASYDRTHLARAMQHQNEAIYTRASALFQSEDILLIADCQHADLFQASYVQNTENGQVIYADALSRIYGTDAQVMRWEVDTYYIAKGQDASLALFQKKLLPERKAVEQVSNLEGFEIAYALLSNQTPLFLNAAQVTHWPSVRGLLLTIKPQHAQPSQFNVVLFNAIL